MFHTVKVKVKVMTSKHFLLTHYTRSNRNHAVSSSFLWVTRGGRIECGPTLVGASICQLSPYVSCFLPLTPESSCQWHQHNNESQAQFILTSFDLRSKLWLFQLYLHIVLLLVSYSKGFANNTHSWSFHKLQTSFKRFYNKEWWQEKMIQLNNVRTVM